MDANTLENTLTESVRSFIFTRSYSQFLFLQFLLWCLRLKDFFSRTLSTRHFYCLLFSLFRLTHVFWENGVHYPTVSLGAHPLTKKPKDSRYENGNQPELPIRGAGQENRSSGNENAEDLSSLRNTAIKSKDICSEQRSKQIESCGKSSAEITLKNSPNSNDNSCEQIQTKALAQTFRITVGSSPKSPEKNRYLAMRFDWLTKSSTVNYPYFIA